MIESAPVPTLLRNASFILEHYVTAGFVRLARTTQPLPSHAQVVEALDGCREALGVCDPAKLGILIDWRLAPWSSKAPDAEDDVVREVQRFSAPFARSALLLLGAAGDERAAQSWAATSLQAFFDEDEAITFVSLP